MNQNLTWEEKQQILKKKHILVFAFVSLHLQFGKFSAWGKFLPDSVSSVSVIVEIVSETQLEIVSETQHANLSFSALEVSVSFSGNKSDTNPKCAAAPAISPVLRRFYCLPLSS